MGDKFMMTAPDLDHSTRLKILVVGLGQDEIEYLTSKIQLLPHTLTLYVYNESDKDIAWCLTAARQCDSVLINTRPSSIDLLKGFLLAMPNSAAYGQNKDAPYALKTHFDCAVWLTEVLLRSQKNLEPDPQA